MENKIRIEVLFPEIANLYGDLENITYLKRSCPDIEVVETHLVGEPLFTEKTPDLIYMGTLTERGQLLAIEKLSAYKEKLAALIDEGVHFLVTGNALEVFGGEIKDVDGTTAMGLGIFPIHAKRDMMHRFNSLYLGKMAAGVNAAGGAADGTADGTADGAAGGTTGGATGDAADGAAGDAADGTAGGAADGAGTEMTIVGYKSQFTHSYWDDAVEAAGAARAAEAAEAAGAAGAAGAAEAAEAAETGKAAWAGRNYMFETERGPGLNPDINKEGIRKNNFMGTYVIGPILVLNPPFAKWLLKEIGAGNVELAFEKEAMEAYEARVKEYSDPNTGFYY